MSVNGVIAAYIHVRVMLEGRMPARQTSRPRARQTPKARSYHHGDLRRVLIDAALQLAAEGKTNADIAARLNISPRTVENHRATLMQRLGFQNQTDLIRYAIRRGLLPPDDVLPL